MFSKLTFSFLPLLLISLFSPYLAHAQDYNQSRLDYQTQYSKYREQLVEFRSARSEYITYKTLVSQTRAIYVTQQFLTTRQELIISYLQLLQSRIASSQSPFLDQQQTNIIANQITQQIDFHKSQVPAIQAASELKDLTNISSRIDTNIATVTTLGIQTQALVLDSRMQEYQDTTVNLMAFTTEQVRRIQAEGQKDTTEIQRWLIQAEQKYTLANQGLSATNAQVTRLRSDRELENYRTSLKRSTQYFKETNTLLNEIVTNLKIK